MNIHHRIDERGFVVWTFPAPLGVDRPRHRLPWTKAEDRFLFRRLRELASQAEWETAKAIGRELGRSGMAVQARYHALRVGIRLVQKPAPRKRRAR